MEKKYYWIKLKQTLLTSDKVDFLMSQKDGANYIVLYQCLCLMCANTNGVLGKEIGEVLIPYDTDKIQRDTKWFTKDTIIVALELYKKLGLIYQADNGLLQITDFDEIVGGESKWAEKKRQYRLGQNKDNVLKLSDTMSDKSIDIDNRDRYKDKDIDNINLKENKKETLTETEYQYSYVEIKRFCEANNIFTNIFSEMSYLEDNKIEDWKTYLLDKYKRK